jgi:hypothetical protein
MFFKAVDEYVKKPLEGYIKKLVGQPKAPLDNGLLKRDAIDINGDKKKLTLKLNLKSYDDNTVTIIKNSSRPEFVGKEPPISYATSYVSRGGQKNEKGSFVYDDHFIKFDVAEETKNSRFLSDRIKIIEKFLSHWLAKSIIDIALLKELLGRIHSTGFIDDAQYKTLLTTLVPINQEAKTVLDNRILNLEQTYTDVFNITALTSYKRK